MIKAQGQHWLLLLFGTAGAGSGGGGGAALGEYGTGVSGIGAQYVIGGDQHHHAGAPAPLEGNVRRHARRQRPVEVDDPVVVAGALFEDVVPD